MAFSVEDEMNKLHDHMMFAADILGEGMLSEEESIVVEKWCGDGNKSKTRRKKKI